MSEPSGATAPVGRLGAAVIGLRMGEAHLKAYLQNPHTYVAGICDTDSALLARIREQYRVPLAVSDYRQLLDRPEIRIVSVASPDYFHAEQSIAALQCGKDVLCEKPLTLSLDEARAIVAAVKTTGRRFMVGQVCRFAPGFALARKMIARGDVGELYFVESEYAHSYAHAPGVGNWRVDPRREPFIGGGCHAVDLLRWVAGEIVEVFAYANHKCLTDWPINDCTVALLKFAGGAAGKVLVSIGCVRPYTMRSVFWGTAGTIICDNTSPEIQVCSRTSPAGPAAFARFPVPVANHNVSDEVNTFVQCLLNNTPVEANEIEGARTVAACVAAAQSARTGMPVRLSELGEFA